MIRTLGEAAGSIHAIRSAADAMTDVCHEAERLLTERAGLVS